MKAKLHIFPSHHSDRQYVSGNVCAESIESRRWFRVSDVLFSLYANDGS